MEMKKGYSVYEHDRLEPADSMRIERKVYFEEKTCALPGLEDSKKDKKTE